MTQRAASRRLFRLTAALIVAGLWVGHAQAQTVTQTFELHPGWNAVFLEVQPEPDDPATVFAGVPIESVWTWTDRNSSVEFIQDPAEEPWGQPGWSGHFAAPEHAFLTNLFAIFANWPYLIKLSGDAPVTWSVTGRPSVRDISWVPDSFNLVGFRVDPQEPPTFATHLGPSRALRGQPAFRLEANGRWQPVGDPATATVHSGEAYWVYCEGGSSYQGPLKVSLPLGESLDFATTLNELTVTLRNASTAALAVVVDPADDVDWLAYRAFDTSLGAFVWPDLRDMPPIPVPAGGAASVRVGIRRERLAPGAAATVLEVTDGVGSRLLVGVSVDKVAP